MPCIQPCQVAGVPPLSIGTSTRNPAKINDTPEQGEQHDRETTCPPARQLIAHRDCEDHNQHARDSEGRNLRPNRTACAPAT